MKPYHLSMLGLAIDIVGAFLVAVEAIKLENLRTLRDRVLKQIPKYLLSPRITFSDDGDPSVTPSRSEVPAERYPGFFMGLHYIAGLVVLVLLDRLIGGRIYGLYIRGVLWTLKRPWYIAAGIIVVFILVVVVAGFWMIGELVHMVLTRTVELPIRIVDFIDQRTPDGTIGVLGFLLLFLGFVLQLFGAYLTGRST